MLPQTIVDNISTESRNPDIFMDNSQMFLETVQRYLGLFLSFPI